MTGPTEQGHELAYVYGIRWVRRDAESGGFPYETRVLDIKGEVRLTVPHHDAEAKSIQPVLVEMTHILLGRGPMALRAVR